ncbi:unnamed protein product [Paramecium primaurelia]|uniref:Uncharacterized protein n=1 Tax=Paramecium primaurelia TaxID=5886 RepID=A0A8S1M3L4_PARPR|nr:unnamed protein product [Paramecium primaurelia]
MKSRFLPTGDKVIVPDIRNTAEYGKLFEEEIFQSKIRAQREYEMKLQEFLDQVKVVDDFIFNILDIISSSLQNSKTPDPSLLSELKKLRLSLKFDDHYKESIEPLNEALLWIKASQHLFSVINQINLLRNIICAPLSQDYIRRMKNFSEDFELLLKEHKSIEVKSPFSFKQQKQPYLESAQQFDELLLRTLKAMKHIQQYSTYSMQIAAYYTEFQYHINGSIKVNQEYMELIHSLVLFYQNESSQFTPLQKALEGIPNNGIFYEQLENVKNLLHNYKKQLNLEDFKELDQIFQKYLKQQQPIFSLEQLRIDLFFILNDEEDFTTVMKSFKRVCSQSILDLDSYDDLLKELINFTSIKRDNKIAQLEDNFIIVSFVQNDKKDWQQLLKLCITKLGVFLKDAEKNQVENPQHYLNDFKHSANQLRPQKNTYSNSNLLQLYDKIIELFEINLNK